MSLPKPENFVLSAEFLAAADLDELLATYTAMEECQIDCAPFAEFFVTVPQSSCMRIVDPETGAECPEEPDRLIEFHYAGLAGRLSVTPRYELAITGWRGKKFCVYSTRITECLEETPNDTGLLSMKEKLENYSHTLLICLIVSLATKGVSKSRERNKLSRLGIGKGRESRHGYTTTIGLAREPREDEPSSGTGLTRRPHLRRGHVRNQHWGPGNLLVKKIFIEAVFVNSDKEFVSLRDHYNVSLHANQKEQDHAIAS